VELLNFLCLVAMIDPEEKRKVMGLLITVSVVEYPLYNAVKSPSS
jgi:hypothetical protein